MTLGANQYSTHTTYRVVNGVQVPDGVYAIGKGARDACYIGAGVLSVVGLGLEISGVINIGKAGLSLNENGIGLKVKF